MRVSYKKLYEKEAAARQAAESRAEALTRKLIALASSQVIIKRSQVVMEDLNATSIFVAEGASLSVNGDCNAAMIHCFGGVVNLDKGFTVESLKNS